MRMWVAWVGMAMVEDGGGGIQVLRGALSGLFLEGRMGGQCCGRWNSCLLSFY